MAPDAGHDDGMDPAGAAAGRDPSAPPADVWVPRRPTADATDAASRPWHPSETARPVAGAGTSSSGTPTGAQGQTLDAPAPPWQTAPVAPAASSRPVGTTASATGGTPPAQSPAADGDDLVQLRDALTSYGDRISRQIELQHRLERELAAARADAAAQAEIVIEREARLERAEAEIVGLRAELADALAEIDRLGDEERQRHGRIVGLVEASNRGLITAIRDESPDVDLHDAPAPEPAPTSIPVVDAPAVDAPPPTGEVPDGLASDAAPTDVWMAPMAPDTGASAVAASTEAASTEAASTEAASTAAASAAASSTGAASPVVAASPAASPVVAASPVASSTIAASTDAATTTAASTTADATEGPTLATMRRWLRRPGAMFVIDGDAAADLAAPGADLHAAREWLAVAVEGLLGDEAPTAEIVFDGTRSSILPTVTSAAGPRVRLTPPGVGTVAAIERVIADHAADGPALAAYEPSTDPDSRRPALWVPVEILADLLTGRRTH